MHTREGRLGRARERVSAQLVSGGNWYAREARMRKLFLASHGELDPARIRDTARCTEGEAQLVAAARRLACLEVLDAFERGAITFRRLWRACEYPGEPARQRTAAQVEAA